MGLLLDHQNSPFALESTIAELEKDCDTLENEANRLLTINRDLREKFGDVEPSQLTNDEKSFASELLDEEIIERPGPEGSEETDEKLDSDRLNEETKPRYTLFELEEVLNEKNKYKGRYCQSP